MELLKSRDQETWETFIIYTDKFQHAAWFDAVCYETVKNTFLGLKVFIDLEAHSVEVHLQYFFSPSYLQHSFHFLWMQLCVFYIPKHGFLQFSRGPVWEMSCFPRSGHQFITKVDRLCRLVVSSQFGSQIHPREYSQIWATLPNSLEKQVSPRMV